MAAQDAKTSMRTLQEHLLTIAYINSHQCTSWLLKLRNDLPTTSMLQMISEVRGRMVRSKQEEVDRNFAFFQAELPKVLGQHRGKYALIRDSKIIGYYDTAVDAQTSGHQLYQDGLFSIQKVTDEPLDLGFYSHAVHLGAA